MHQNAPRTSHHAAARSHGQEPQSYRVEHDPDSAATLSATLTHAISDVTGVDVSNTEGTIGEYVDLDAVDRLFGPGSGGARHLKTTISFELWGHAVTVHSGGDIVIVPPRSRSQPTARPAAAPSRGPDSQFDR
jgi:hypothetical protein